MADQTTRNNTQPILLKDIWPIERGADYKVHFGRWNGHTQPLDAWVRDPLEWVGWQEYRPQRNMFNRPYIFSLMNFYPDDQRTWLFGGIFRILARHKDRYQVELTDQGESFIGRLKLWSNYTERATRVDFEDHYNGRYSLNVTEILRESYSGRAFPGYEKIDLSFSELEVLVRNDRPDWKNSLKHVKGVYLITDTSAPTHRYYIGSAYGDQGIWSRWSSYIETGHGGNVELKKLVPDLDYCRSNFQFALLEYLPAYTEDAMVIEREAHWKQILLSRKYGLNQN